MFRIGLNDIPQNECLARAIYDENGVPMVTAGTRLTPQLVASLRKRGYTSVFVKGEGTDDIEIDEYLRPEVRRRIVSRLRDAFETIQTQVASAIDPAQLAGENMQAFRDRLQTPRLQKVLARVALPPSFIQDVYTMIDEVLAQRRFAATLHSIKSVDAALLDHAMDVTINTLLLGRLFWPQALELSKLAMGCLFHDIGILFLPRDIATGAVTLTEKQAAQYRLHTVYGYMLLHELPQVNLLATHIAFQHHEHQDGTGYPRGLLGDNTVYTSEDAVGKGSGKIHRYANLAAVTNTFDRLTMPHPHGHGMTQDQAVRVIHEYAGTRLNAEAAADFLKMTPAYPLGSMALITAGEFKGYKAVVAKIDPENLDTPTLRLLYDRKRHRLEPPIEIDLKEYDKPIGLRAIGM